MNASGMVMLVTVVEPWAPKVWQWIRGGDVLAVRSLVLKDSEPDGAADK